MDGLAIVAFLAGCIPFSERSFFFIYFTVPLFVILFTYIPLAIVCVISNPFIILLIAEGAVYITIKLALSPQL